MDEREQGEDQAALYAAPTTERGGSPDDDDDWEPITGETEIVYPELRNAPSTT